MPDFVGNNVPHRGRHEIALLLDAIDRPEGGLPRAAISQERGFADKRACAGPFVQIDMKIGDAPSRNTIFAGEVNDGVLDADALKRR